VSEPQRRTDGWLQSTCSGVIGKPQKKVRGIRAADKASA